MRDAADSQGDRLAMRRVRRWRRRARIAAPFLVVPAMLGLLLLSVDLIEYQPSESPERAKLRPRDADPAIPANPSEGSAAMALAPDPALSVSVVGSPLADESPPSAPQSAAESLSAWPGGLSSAARP